MRLQVDKELFKIWHFYKKFPPESFTVVHTGCTVSVNISLHIGLFLTFVLLRKVILHKIRAFLCAITRAKPASLVTPI